MKKFSLFWFRRDLRLHDNAGLYHALKSGLPVLPLFIFDTTILSRLEDRADARVTFIHQQISLLNEELEKYSSALLVKRGNPIEVFEELIKSYSIDTVYTNHDYEPSAIVRDAKVEGILSENEIHFSTFKDSVIFEKDEILTDAGSPYKVYTPYKNKWLLKVNDFYLKSYPSEKKLDGLAKLKQSPLPTLASLGFENSLIEIPPTTVASGIIKQYHAQRDFPFIEGTSRLGIHFRFGTISIREKARKAKVLNEVWLSELIWRDFFVQLLFHFPYVVNEPFSVKFNKVSWRTSEDDFEKWCVGKTGYPMVDSGMRELNSTGHMHNRVRMVVASFLTKHLLIDWRWGEAYFASKLLDFDLASNNGNWQWCAGTGADAQPYFRIFNPTSQQQKFDPDFVYIKKWIPEFGTAEYPAPMIEHKLATARAKEAFLVLTQ